MSNPSATDITIMKSQSSSQINATVIKVFLDAYPAMRSLLSATDGIGALILISKRKRNQGLYLSTNHHTATGKTTITTGDTTDCVSPLAVSFSDAVYHDLWKILTKSDVIDGMVVVAKFKEGSFSGDPFVITKLPKSIPLSFGHSTFSFGPITEHEQLD